MCPNSSQTNFTNLGNNCPFSAGHTGTNINRWSLLFWHRNFKAIFLQVIPRRGVFIWTGPHSNLNPHHPKGSTHPIVVAPEPWGSFLEFHFTAWGILLSSETLLDFGEQFGNCPLTSMNVPPCFPRDVKPFCPSWFRDILQHLQVYNVMPLSPPKYVLKYPVFSKRKRPAHG